MYKTFNFIIIIFSIILVLFSVVTFTIIQIDLFNYPFNFSPKGLNAYLDSFAKYNSLFAATVTLIVAYFGIKRLEAADKSNNDKLKQDRYSDWKIVTDIRIDEIENNNKRFRREFYKIRYNLFLDLYPLDLSIKNKKDLELIFDKHIKSRVTFFEEMTEKHIWMGGIYRDNQYTYFFEDLYYILIGSLNNQYSELYQDFKNLYLENLNPERTIDEKMFYSAQTRYTGLI